jgi:hypothetical protein
LSESITRIYHFYYDINIFLNDYFLI